MKQINQKERIQRVTGMKDLADRVFNGTITPELFNSHSDLMRTDYGIEIRYFPTKRTMSYAERQVHYQNILADIERYIK